MKLTIITPSYNSGKTIERSIKSVLAQDYQDYEHIIIDGGSTDETLSIVKNYPHLKWLSEPDRGQVHALKKGFDLAGGEVIGILNADDYYLEDTFPAVMPLFVEGEKMVMGKIRVCSEKPGGITEWICDPKTDFFSVLRHWEQDAFCVNPVGYFYRREVQEEIPLREETGSRHDLEFLMEAANRYSIKKIDRILGVFNHALDTQTGREQLIPSYWQPENFSFVDRLAAKLTKKEQEQFSLERERGYQYRRHCTAKEAFALGMEKELFDKGEVFLLPEDENECIKNRCGFVEHDRIATSGDWIIPVFVSGKVASQSICRTLKSLPASVLAAQVYHGHQMNTNTIYRHLPRFLPEQSHAAVGLSLKHLYDCHNKNLKWKFIAGVREPISGALSGVFENWPQVKANEISSKILKVLKYRLNHFSIQYIDAIGFDVYDYPFDHEKKYTIIEKDNISILVYRLEELSETFSRAMQEFLGLQEINLAQVNLGEEKMYAKKYKEAKEVISFENELLDEVYSSKFTRHFYTEDEINSFYERWRINNNSCVNNTKITRINKKDKIANIHAAKEKDYIIFFVPRSGSTLLTELLVKTNVLGNPQEWLNKDCFKYFQEKYGYNTDLLENYLITIHKEQRTANGVFGMEMAHHQFKVLGSIDKLWKHFDKTTKFIFLRRENVLEQAVSLYKSRMSNVWHAWSDKYETVSVEYNYKELMKSLRVLVKEEVSIIDCFMQNNIFPLIITYEEIVNNPYIETINRIANYVGVELPHDFNVGQVLIKKMGNRGENRQLTEKFVSEARDLIVLELLRLKQAHLRWGLIGKIKKIDDMTRS